MSVQTSDKIPAAGFAGHLLAWYDESARTLPWRHPPGSLEPPDPYRVWLSEIMLQQTTVASVAGYYRRFITAWPTVEDLAGADDADVMAAWAGLGYYARARNLLACARQVVTEHDGRFPEDEAALLRLPGIGAYTAAAMAAIAFGRPAIVIDANVERVMARHRAILTPLPRAKADIRTALAPLVPGHRAGDFAQAMMDLGATICTARRPDCPLCPIRADCLGKGRSDLEKIPVKAAKRPKPQRYGIAHWIEQGGAIWLERRPAKGMLGGMRALPGNDWTDSQQQVAALAEVQHSFTHFDLRLALIRCAAPDSAAEGEWWPVSTLDAAGLPTLYRKLVQKMQQRMQEQQI